MIAPKVTNWKDFGDRERHGKSWRGNNYWYEFTLQEAAKDLEPFDLPLAAIDMSFVPWGINNLHDIIYHVDRVQKVDSSYPVILDEFGTLIDGFHRVVAAVIKGETTIRAVKIDSMPPIDGSKEG